MYIPSMWASEERIDSLEGVATRDAEAISMTSVTRSKVGMSERVLPYSLILCSLITYLTINRVEPADIEML